MVQLGLDVEVYKQMKPLLTAMWFEAKTLETDMTVAFKMFIGKVMASYGANAPKYKPYVMKFAQEVLDGKIMRPPPEKQAVKSDQRGTCNEANIISPYKSVATSLAANQQRIIAQKLAQSDKVTSNRITMQDETFNMTTECKYEIDESIDELIRDILAPKVPISAIYTDKEMDLMERMEEMENISNRARWKAEEKADNFRTEMILLGIFGVLPILSVVGFYFGVTTFIAYGLWKFFTRNCD